MKAKEKRCGAKGRAAGYTGCGLPSLHRKYGLCMKCYHKWLRSTPEGKEIIQQAIRKASKGLLKISRKEHREKKAEVKTMGKIKGDLQKEINTIVRLIDHGRSCISCEHGTMVEWTRQRQAGHRLSVGSTPSLRYNLWNIFCQCSICNHRLSSNPREYDKGIVKLHGTMVLNQCKSLLLQYPELKASREELIQATKKAREIIREINKGKDFTRDEVNNLIGLYK